MGNFQVYKQNIYFLNQEKKYSTNKSGKYKMQQVHNISTAKYYFDIWKKLKSTRKRSICKNNPIIS